MTSSRGKSPRRLTTTFQQGPIRETNDKNRDSGSGKGGTPHKSRNISVVRWHAVKEFVSTRKKKHGRQKRRRYLTRFKPLLCVNEREHLRATVKQFTRPGKGFLDLTADDQISAEFQDGLSPEECRNNYFNAYMRASSKLAPFIPGLMVTRDMLDFDKSRRTVISFKQIGVTIGVKLTYDISAIKEPKLGDIGIRDSGVFEDVSWDDDDLTPDDYDNVEEGDDIIDSLPEILNTMRDLGVCLLMWGVRFNICYELSKNEIKNHCMDLAHFARTCQVHQFVSILSLELRQDPELNLEEAGHVLREILVELVKTLHEFNVYTEGVIIALNPLSPEEKKVKINNIRHRPIYQEEEVTEEHLFTITTVAELRAKATARILHQTLPCGTGIVMTNYPSTPLTEINDILNAINQCPVPRFCFHVGFCFSKVVQEGFLSRWAGREMNWDFACSKLVSKAQLCADAAMGTLYPSNNSSCFISSVCSLEAPWARGRIV